jgi:hypothetical protein
MLKTIAPTRQDVRIRELFIAIFVGVPELIKKLHFHASEFIL